ncbi:MAG: phosphoglycolate phosphatase [Burkholderiales bacterium]|nr:phosphoglycolate phosphatase [Burkholderiales bacterium]MDE2454861.1 phosphoglycolate phosphatase [Burkholderiales bacterium]
MLRAAAVLFDLDGTLVDSAPDLAGAANEMRSAQGLEPLPYERLRPMVGSGARGMLGAALGVAPGDAGFEALRDEFLDRYERRLTRETALFANVEALLRRIEAEPLRWGIVTNKALRFAEPLVAALALARRASVLIGGDSTPHTKPHPEPLLEAARRLGVDPARCVYVGDDPRDMRAGRAAGMATVAAAWGYLGAEEPIEHWGADLVIEEPAALLHWLDLA